MQRVLVIGKFTSAVQESAAASHAADTPAAAEAAAPGKPSSGYCRALKRRCSMAAGPSGEQRPAGDGSTRAATLQGRGVQLVVGARRSASDL